MRPAGRGAGDPHTTTPGACDAISHPPISRSDMWIANVRREAGGECANTSMRQSLTDDETHFSLPDSDSGSRRTQFETRTALFRDTAVQAFVTRPPLFTVLRPIASLFAIANPLSIASRVASCKFDGIAVAMCSARTAPVRVTSENRNRTARDLHCVRLHMICRACIATRNRIAASGRSG